MGFLQVSLQKFGGGAIDALEFSESLRTQGIKHQVIINAENELQNRFESFLDRPVHKVQTYHSSIGSFIYQTLVLWRVVNLLSLIRRLKPTVVYATHFHPWLFFVILLRLFLHFKFIYVAHENPFTPKESTNRAFLWLEKYCIRHADIIVAHSNFIREQITYSTSVPSFTLPLGAYHHLFTDFKKIPFTGTLRLLFLGRIEPYKGLEILLEAFSLLKQKKLPLTLTIAGRGSISQDLVIKFNNLGVHFLNEWVTVENMKQLVAKADVIVLPYTQASQSGVISIALAYGMPVIATRVGGMVEQVQDEKTGFLFESGNVTNLAEKIERFFLNPSLLDQMSGQALVFGKKDLSWEEGVKKLVDYLRHQHFLI